jgi:hypothetical protein
MFGGPPMMMAQPMPRPVAQPAYNPPAPVVAAPQLPPQSQPAAPRVTVRGVPEDPAPLPPRPAQLAVPTPEQCNVAPRPAASGADWSTAHARLDRLGATCFHLEHLTGGTSRVTCLVPVPESGQTRHFEARAASDAEAVQLVLNEAEKWARK